MERRCRKLKRRNPSRNPIDRAARIVAVEAVQGRTAEALAVAINDAPAAGGLKAVAKAVRVVATETATAIETGVLKAHRKSTSRS
jgi:hypothetical protein